LNDTDAGTIMGMFSSKGTGGALRAAGALSTVGLAFVLALVIGFWFGTRLDGWLGTKPVLTIVFFFFGLAAGVLNVYRIVSQAYPKQAGPPAAPVNPRGPQTRAPGNGAGPDDRELHNDE
jgi:F0F1-type ATP synthase assembly protein I